MNAFARALGIAAAGTALLLAGGGEVLAEAFRVAPGPAVMSEDEKAITVDPTTGAEHGVILLEETDNDETAYGYSKSAYHLRAKILSNEARSLGDITIPVNVKASFLTEWWGRVILPDGTVRELSKKDLTSEVVAESRGAQARVLKGALPGIVPGAVVDFGWVYHIERWPRGQTIPLQRRWPIRRFRYRWHPAGHIPAQYYVPRHLGVDVKVNRQREWVLIEAFDVPAAVDEPYMPPAQAVRAHLSLIYGAAPTKYNGDPNGYWRDSAMKTEETLALAVSKSKEGLDRAIMEMGIPADAGAVEKARAIYEWLAANIKDRSVVTPEEEEIEALGDDDEKKDREKEKEKKIRTMGDVIEAREAWPYQFNETFIGLARRAGAEARLVFAADRRTNYWDPLLLSSSQFGGLVVAVKAPGDPGGRTVLVAPGRGLPWGLIPWWLTPTKGLLVDAEGGRDIDMLPPDPRSNVLDSRVKISFEEPAGGVKVSWTALGSGQRGLQERRALPRETPEEREKSLRAYCGHGSSYDVGRASAPAYADLTAAWQLECEGEWLESAAVTDESDTASVGIDGPWIPEPPVFASPDRAYPIVFDYPRIDLATIEIASPSGFTTSPAPSPIKVTRPFASYALKVVATSAGYKVERAFALLVPALPKEEYPALRSFLEEVRKADRTSMAFKRTGGAS